MFKFNFSLIIFFSFICSFSLFAQWEQTNGPYGGYVSCFAVFDNNLFVGTHNGVYLSTNSGTNWVRAGEDLTDIYVISLASLGTNLFAGAYGSGIFRSTNNGINWTQTFLNYSTVSSFAVSGIHIFAGTGNGVFLSTDNGINWVEVNNGLINTSVSSLAILGSNLFAGTVGGGVFLSTNNGTNWIAVNSGLIDLNISDLVISGGSIFTGTLDGGVFRSTNNGTSWVQSGLAFTQVYSMTSSDPNLFAGTLDGVYHSIDGGTNWTQIGLTIESVGSFAVFGSNLIAGTPAGVFLSTNNGFNWTQSNSGLNNSNVPSIILLNQNLFAATQGGGVFRSSDNGESWIAVNNGLTSRFIVRLLSQDNYLFASPIYGQFFRSSNNGENWEYVNSPWGWTVTAFANIGMNLFAGSEDGEFFHSTNYGTDWFVGGYLPYGFRALAVSETNLFAGTIGGGVFLSTNHGTSWTTLNNGLTNFYITSLTISGTNIFAGTLDGIFLSTNNGSNWTAASNGLPSNSNIQSLSVSGTNLFAGTYGGGVFCSTDNGTYWVAVNEGLTNGNINSLMVSDSYLFACISNKGVWKRPLSDFVPVELTSFSAVVSDDNVELSWITSTETNNQGFEIQRSKDGEFETIGFVDGHGTTTESQAYSFTDNNVIAGNYTYRLKQIDYDGAFEYSNVIEVEVTSPSTFSLEQNYPNPFNPSTKIRYTIPSVIASETKYTQFVSLKIYDVLGNEVATLVDEYKPAGTYEINFSGEGLNSGIYFYKLQAGSFSETKKMILIK